MCVICKKNLNDLPYLEKDNYNFISSSISKSKNGIYYHTECVNNEIKKNGNIDTFNAHKLDKKIIGKKILKKNNQYNTYTIPSTNLLAKRNLT
jgi:hypothetical protein